MLVLFKLVMASSLMGSQIVDSENNQCPAHRLAVYKLQLNTFWSEQVLNTEFKHNYDSLPTAISNFGHRIETRF